MNKSTLNRLQDTLPLPELLMYLGVSYDEAMDMTIKEILDDQEREIAELLEEYNE